MATFTQTILQKNEYLDSIWIKDKNTITYT